MRSAPLCGSRIRWLLAAVNDRALWALRTWLDSWPGIGYVAVGMHRQGYDLQLTQYDERGWSVEQHQLHASDPRAARAARLED